MNCTVQSLLMLIFTILTANSQYIHKAIRSLFFLILIVSFIYSL